MTPYFQFIFKIFLKSVTLCLITNPYNPKYSRLQNKKRFHVNANGHLRMYCLRHQLPQSESKLINGVAGKTTGHVILI